MQKVNVELVRHTGHMLKVAVRDARAPRSGQSNELQKKKSTVPSAVYDAELDGVCLSSMWPIYMKVTPALRVWLLQHFTPACERAAETEPDEPGSQPKIGGAFSFGQAAMRVGVRGKVVWDVDQHTWKLNVRKPKPHYVVGQCVNGKSLSIHKRLTLEQYREAMVSTGQWEPGTGLTVQRAIVSGRQIS